jgi:carboxyl-terminal processing protease
MDIVKGMLRLLVVSVLVALIAGVAYLVGFGSGYSAGLTNAPRTIAAIQAPPTLPAAEGTPTPRPVAPTRAPRVTVTPTASSAASSDEEAAFQVFWEAWKLLKDEYYGDLPEPQKMARAAIRGVLDTLDDKNTALIDPEISKIISEDSSGSFEGIGAMVQINQDNVLEITRLFPGQPAETAGVKAGDVVIAVDGRSIVGYSVYEAIALIRGPAGTTVKLTIVRKGEAKPLEIGVTRAKIVIPLVQSKMLDGDIAYVSLSNFSSPNASSQLETEIESLLAQKPKGLILDLRDNPGGYLQQSLQVADIFLDGGVIASEKDRDGNGQTFRATPRGAAQDIPLVVLVNGGSASASEIVAGALQDRGRAKLIGETTFGKGSVQLPHQLSDGSELRVTIAHWFTPNDRQIDGTGLTPDIAVPLTQDDAKAGRDPQLDRAVQYLLNGK